MKKCSCCHKIKSLNEFHLNYTSLDNRSYYCKTCKRELYKKNKPPKNKLYVVDELPLSKGKVSNTYGISYLEYRIDYEMRRKSISQKYHHLNQVL